MKPSELSRVIVDTTVQPKHITFPTDAKLMNRAREKLVQLAKKLGVELRQSYTRVGKFALIQHQRYAHAKQFKRANRALRTLKTYLGRVIRDIARKIDGDHGLEGSFAHLLSLSRQVRQQERGQRGAKVYSLHAPEVECIGNGKAHKPYELMAWTTPALRGNVLPRGAAAGAQAISNTNIITIGIDLGKNTFHVVGLDATGAITLRKKRSRISLTSR